MSLYEQHQQHLRNHAGLLRTIAANLDAQADEMAANPPYEVQPPPATAYADEDDGDEPVPVASGNALEIARTFRFRSDDALEQALDAAADKYGMAVFWSAAVRRYWTQLAGIESRLIDAGMDKGDLARLINYFGAGQRGTGFDALGKPVVILPWGKGMPS